MEYHNEFTQMLGKPLPIRAGEYGQTYIVLPYPQPARGKYDKNGLVEISAGILKLGAQKLRKIRKELHLERAV